MIRSHNEVDRRLIDLYLLKKVHQFTGEEAGFITRNQAMHLMAAGLQRKGGGLVGIGELVERSQGSGAAQPTQVLDIDRARAAIAPLDVSQGSATERSHYTSTLRTHRRGGIHGSADTAAGALEGMGGHTESQGTYFDAPQTRAYRT